MGKRTTLIAAAALGFGLFASSAHASLTFSGSSGTRSAAATFQIVSGKLEVVLENTSPFDVGVPIDVLTGVLFTVGGTGPGQLTPFSATSDGPTYLAGVQVSASGTNVGGEWIYSSVTPGAYTPNATVNAGISSSGLSPLFGSANFGGANLSGPASVNGLQYGITSAGDNLATGNGGVQGNEITKNRVKFLLDFTNMFTVEQVSNVVFQYGTAMDEPSVPYTDLPGPESTLFVGLGLVLLASLRRLRT